MANIHKQISSFIKGQGECPFNVYPDFNKDDQYYWVSIDLVDQCEIIPFGSWDGESFEPIDQQEGNSGGSAERCYCLGAEWFDDDQPPYPIDRLEEIE